MAIVFSGLYGYVTLLVILIAAINWVFVLLSAVADLHYPTLDDARNSKNLKPRTPFEPVHPLSKDLFYFLMLAVSNSLRQHNFKSTLGTPNYDDTHKSALKRLTYAQSTIYAAVIGAVGLFVTSLILNNGRLGVSHDFFNNVKVIVPNQVKNSQIASSKASSIMGKKPAGGFIGNDASLASSMSFTSSLGRPASLN